MADYWFSTHQITAWVKADGGKIQDAAPVLRRFIGYTLGDLMRWGHKQGGEKLELLKGK
jgi:hypothetical protein